MMFAKFLVAVVITLAYLSGPSFQLSFQQEGLVHLGTVEGKSFYVNTTAVIWLEAQYNCNSNGLRLGGATSSVQADFLRNINFDVFYDYVWTGGRDAKEMRQLSWDHNGQPMPNETWSNVMFMYPPQTCVSALIGSDHYMLEARPCSSTYYALCETV